MSIRQASLESSAIAQHFDSQVNFTAQVMTDPNQSVSGKYSFTARILAFDIDKKHFQLRVPVHMFGTM